MVALMSARDFHMKRRHLGLKKSSFHFHRDMQKVVVFDLDDTLIHEGFSESEPRLCAETPKVLEYLLQKGHKLSIASHNHRALKILETIHLHDHFAVVCGYVPKCVTKNPHIEEILTALKAQKDSIVLFDDLQSNITAAKQYGVSAHLVNWKTGITFKDVQRARL